MELTTSFSLPTPPLARASKYSLLSESVPEFVTISRSAMTPGSAPTASKNLHPARVYVGKWKRNRRGGARGAGREKERQKPRQRQRQGHQRQRHRHRPRRFREYGGQRLPCDAREAKTGGCWSREGKGEETHFGGPWLLRDAIGSEEHEHNEHEKGGTDVAHYLDRWCQIFRSPVSDIQISHGDMTRRSTHFTVHFAFHTHYYMGT